MSDAAAVVWQGANYQQLHTVIRTCCNLNSIVDVFARAPLTISRNTNVGHHV